MKIGVEVQIDVKKIEKARLYAGAKGTYLTMTTFIDLDEKDQYENNGFISHKKNKDEQNNTPILGNVKVFWKDEQQQQAPQQQMPQQGGYQQQAPQQAPQQQGGYQQAPPQQQAPQQGGYQQQVPQQSPMAQNPNASQDFDDDIPF